MRGRVLWLWCSWGLFWTPIIKLLVIAEDLDVVRLGFKVFKWLLFPGHCMTPSFLHRLCSGTALQGLWPHRHPQREQVLGNLPLQQQYSYRQSQIPRWALTNCFRKAQFGQTRVSANEGLSSSHSYPPRLYQQRSAAGAQPNLYFFSLQNNIQEVIQNANTSNQPSILCRRRLEKVSPCPLPALPGQMQHKTPVAPVLPCFTPSSCSPPLRSTRTCPRDKQLDLGAEIPCEQDSQRSKRHSRCLWLILGTWAINTSPFEPTVVHFSNCVSNDAFGLVHVLVSSFSSSAVSACTRPLTMGNGKT